MGEINVGGIRIGVSLGTEDLAKGIKNLQRDLRKVGKSLQSVGKDLTIGLSAPIVAIGTLAAKSAINFESAFAGVRKTVKATEQEFAVLNKGILGLSKKLPTSATEIAKIAENAGQLGIKKENILAFSETMTRLSDSTNIASDEGSKLLAQFANFTNLPQTQFSNLGSAIVELGNNTATTEDKIVDMAHGIGAASSQVGISHGQIIGLSAAISATGIEAEKGGSAFSKALRDMNTAVLSNSDDLKAYSKIAGTDFKKAFQEDAGAAVVSFIRGLQGVAKSGGDMAAALNTVGISELRAVDTFSRLALSADKVSDALDMGKQAFQENSALTRESEERYKTLASQIEVTKNKLTALGISFGNEITPYLKDLNKTLGESFSYFEELDSSTKKAIVTFSVMIGVAGPLTIAIGSLFAIFGSTATLLGGGLVIGVSAAITAFISLRSELNNLNPVLRGYLLLVSAAYKATRFDFTGAISDVKEVFSKTNQEIKESAKSLEDSFGMLQRPARIGNSTIEELNKAVAKNDEESKKAAESSKKLATELSNVGGGSKEATKDIKETEKALDSLNKKIAQAAQNDNEDFITANLQGAIDANAPQGTIESLQNQLYEITRSTVEQAHLDAGGVINDETKKSIDQLTTYEYKKKLESFRVNAKKEESIVEDSFKRLPDFLAKGITDALINGLDEGFSSDTFKDLGKSIGAVFADSFQTKFKGLFEKGAFDNLLSGSFSDFLTGSGLADLGIAYGTTSLANNLSDNKKDPVGGVVAGAALGASIGSIVPGIGTAIGALVGAAGGFVAGSIGKNNDPGARKRKDTINFIEGKIANSYLPFLTEQGNIILGDSKRFNIKDGGSFFSSVGDLVVDAAAAYMTMGASLGASAATGTDAHEIAGGGVGYQNRPGEINGPEWGQQFENQFQTVFNSFNALGGAMSQFSGQTQDEAAKIGVVLAENLNGNLDNARMLLQTMGVGAKDLEEAFLQIGLSGEQSWHTVEIYMQSISDLTGEGLIGVGDLQGAFGQLTDSAGRGQAALFALQNLAIEAQEKGINNISELRAAMLSSGEFSESDVNILFQAIEQRGITTLEGLQGASQRLLGGVIADLESLGFGWTKFNEIANQASLTLSELEQKMNELNDTTIDLNIRVNYQENDKPDTLGDAEILANKNGNIFEGSTIKKFAKGGIFDSTTMFGYGNKLGMLGEAGPEAVMPLMRKNGKLGVMAQPMGGGQGMVINIDARGAERGVERNIMAAMSQMEDRILGRAMRAMSRGY